MVNTTMSKIDNLMELISKAMPYLEKQLEQNPELRVIVKQLEEHLDAYYGDYD
jgi:lipopolysaccharide biosynthesis regulator YciM